MDPFWIEFRDFPNYLGSNFAKKISKSDLNELYDALIMSDLGVSISEQLITDLKKKKIEDGKLKEEVVSFLEEQFNENDHNFVFKKKLP